MKEPSPPFTESISEAPEYFLKLGLLILFISFITGFSSWYYNSISSINLPSDSFFLQAFRYPSETKTFTTGATITGKESGFTGTIATIYSDVTNQTGTSWAADEESQNVDFEITADGFIDFSESNPFGDPSETY